MNNSEFLIFYQKLKNGEVLNAATEFLVRLKLNELRTPDPYPVLGKPVDPRITSDVLRHMTELLRR